MKVLLIVLQGSAWDFFLLDPLQTPIPRPSEVRPLVRFSGWSWVKHPHTIWICHLPWQNKEQGRRPGWTWSLIDSFLSKVPFPASSLPSTLHPSFLPIICLSVFTTANFLDSELSIWPAVISWHSASLCFLFGHYHDINNLTGLWQASSHSLEAGQEPNEAKAEFICSFAREFK